MTETAKPVKRRSAGQWAVAWRRFRRNKSGLAGIVIVGGVVALALYGIFDAPYPARSFVCLYQGCTNLPPFQSWAHPLGTELSGIDVWSEIAHGASGDLYVGVAATLISVIIGIAVGAVAGYRGGIAEPSSSASPRCSSSSQSLSSSYSSRKSSSSSWRLAWV